MNTKLKVIAKMAVACLLTAGFLAASVSVYGQSLKKSVALGGGLRLQYLQEKFYNPSVPGGMRIESGFSASPELSVYVFSRNPLFHRLSLTGISGAGTPFRSDLDTTGATIAPRPGHITAGLHYNFGFLFFQNKKYKVKPYIAAGFGVNVGYSNLVPSFQSSMFRSETTLGITTEIIPGMIWNISPKFFLDLSTPIELMGHKLTFAGEKNGLTGQEGTREAHYTSTINFMNPIRIQAKIGFGIRF